MKKNFTLLTIIIGLLFGGNVLAQNFIQIKGSDTIVNLSQKLAEAYMEKNPNVSIAVTGGGSGVGIAALIANRVQIANSSREMKEKEYAQAKENGVIPTEIAIAIDGLSVTVNASNPIKSLTKDQVGAIFRGEITNWSEVGGPNLAISLYGRQPNSGTYVFFQEFVLGNKDYSPKMKQMNGNAQIIEGIKTDKGAIGYVGIGYLHDEHGKMIEGIKVLEIAPDAKSKPVSPLIVDNVKSGLYPIARPLYQYTNGKPKGAVKDLIAFELGPEGQKIVEEMGFYPVSGKYIEQNKKAGF
ncbi:MAG: phosphate ABC transporter substrate-binding protein [candidate division KSB1 bacterium]|nr:phosphate ABC transporter substrate-binding protein [candidate division KSB1 bacterium]